MFGHTLVLSQNNASSDSGLRKGLSFHFLRVFENSERATIAEGVKSNLI